MSVSTDTPLPIGRLTLTEVNRSASFPHERLVAYHRQDWRSLAERASLEEEVKASPYWQTHLESLRFLDVELPAAVQDGLDLQSFDPERAETLCVFAAVSEGELFARALLDPTRVREETLRKWDRHTARCVFCRRMKRQALTRVRAEKAGLPRGELLTRDWVVRKQFADILRQRTEEIIKSARRKALPRLVKRLPAEQESILVEHVVRKVPLERIAAIQNRNLGELEALIAQAIAKLPRLYHEGICEAIEEHFSPQSPR